MIAVFSQENMEKESQMYDNYIIIRPDFSQISFLVKHNTQTLQA